MTESEARIILNLKENDSPSEAFEDQLFLLKQYFTTRPIIWSTFQSKLKQVSRLQEAADHYNLENSEKFIFEPFEPFEPFEHSKSILEAITNYQRIKSVLFQKIYLTASANELNDQIEQLLTLNSAYLKCWPDNEIDPSTVILSKEPDPMELLADANDLKSKGILTFDALAKLLTSESTRLKNESKRLYLLQQREEEWKRSLKN